MQVNNSVKDGSGYSEHPVGNYIIELTSRHSGTVPPSGNKIAFIEAVTGDIAVSVDLSTGTSDEMLNVFAQVKKIDASNLKWMIFTCGKGGRIKTMISTDTQTVGSGYDVYSPGISAVANIVDINHGLTTEDLKRICFVSELEGYCFGDNYTILKTVDSGTTWTSVYIKPINGYDTTCYDGIAVKIGLVVKYYLKLKNTASGLYDILEFN